MCVGYLGDRFIYFGDIVSVECIFFDCLGMSGWNGKFVYYICILCVNEVNIVVLFDDINFVIKELNEGLLVENGLVIELSFDVLVYICNVLLLVKSNLGLGVLLLCLILWLFFRGLKVMFVIVVIIFVFLLVVFLMLNIFDCSLNVILLVGFVFVVGLVFDVVIIV